MLTWARSPPSPLPRWLVGTSVWCRSMEPSGLREYCKTASSSVDIYNSGVLLALHTSPLTVLERNIKLFSYFVLHRHLENVAHAHSSLVL